MFRNGWLKDDLKHIVGGSRYFGVRRGEGALQWPGG